MCGVKIICIRSIHGANALVYSIIQNNYSQRVVLRHTSVHQKLISRARFYPTLGLQPKLGLENALVRVGILWQVVGLGEFHNGLIDGKIAGLLYAPAPGSEIKYNWMKGELV